MILKHFLKYFKDKEKLPIFKFKSQILQAVHSNNVIVLAGDTGSKNH